jgi:hypothetical protein
VTVAGVIVATNAPRPLSVDRPLDLRFTDDIEETHRRLVAAGATAMLAIGGELLAERDGIPLAGIRDVPGGRAAVLKAADGKLLGLWQKAR